MSVVEGSVRHLVRLAPCQDARASATASQGDAKQPGDALWIALEHGSLPIRSWIEVREGGRRLFRDPFRLDAWQPVGGIWVSSLGLAPGRREVSVSLEPAPELVLADSATLDAILGETIRREVVLEVPAR